MKKTFLFVFTIFSFSQLMFAIPKEDSPHVGTPKKEALTDNKKSTVHPAFDTVQIQYIVKKGDSVKVSFNTSKDSTSTKNCGCVPRQPSDPDVWQILLAFLPFIIFIVIFFAIGIPKGFELKDALTENEQTRVTVANKEYTIANLSTLKDTPNVSVLLPPTIEITSDDRTYRPSISRYIAFLASILTLIIALGMSGFFIYHYISTGCPPDLSSLSPILIALGIGVAPYAINKVSSAVKSKSE